MEINQSSGAGKPNCLCVRVLGRVASESRSIDLGVREVQAEGGRAWASQK